MSDAIRQHITRLREEVEKRYREGLEAIKRLEETLVGSGAPQESAQPDGDGATQMFFAPRINRNRSVSQVDSVLGALRDAPKTINELATAIPEMTPIQIRAVLYSSRIRKQVKKLKSAKGIKFRLKGDLKKSRNAPMSKTNSAAALVLNLIAENPSGLTSSEIANALENKIESNANNKRNTISSALYNLKRASAIRYDADSKRYSPAIHGNFTNAT